MSRNESGFLHYRRTSAFAQYAATGGYTVAYNIANGVARIGIARCSVNDNFDKAAGRELAISRIGEYIIPAKNRLDLESALDQMLPRLSKKIGFVSRVFRTPRRNSTRVDAGCTPR